MTEITLFSIEEAARLPLDFCRKHFPNRTARSERFVRREDALRCLGAGALLFGALGVREEELREGERHKLFVPNAERRFNLSHSGKYAVLATDSSEVGVDIERIDPSHLDLAREVYLPEEREWMAPDPAERFYRLWTLKESVMKQCGLGFSLSPRSFSVLPLLAGGTIAPQGEPLYAETMIFDGHAIAVCTPHPSEGAVLRETTAEEILQKDQPPHLS